LVEIKPQHVI